MSKHDKIPTCPNCHKPMTYDNQMDYAFFCCDDCNLEIPHYQSAKVWRARKSYKECYEAGQQNPDPKQYANKKELVEEIEKERKEIDLKADDDVIIPLLETMDIVLNIIKNHGLEE